MRIGCVGAGYFSGFHFEAWNRNPRTELVACTDASLDKAKRTIAPLAFESLEKMLLECQLDILDVITPPPSHLAVIQQAVTSSVRVIICQKPFCTSYAEAQQAVSIAERAGVPLVIHENFRFQPWFRKMKQAIDDHLLGEILQLTFRLRTGDGQGENAYRDHQPYFRTMPRLLIHETGIHYVDTFQYLLGSAKTVYADLRTLNPSVKGEDAGYILMGFEGGKRALFDGNRLLDHCSSDTRTTFGEALLEGTLGQITLDGAGQVCYREFRATKRHVLLEPKIWPGFAGDCVYALQDHVVCALLGDAEFENLAADYLPVIQLVNKIYDSSKCGTRLNLN